MTSFKHLTHEQRVIIEDRLNHGISIRQIAIELEKSPSTILREVRNNATYIMSSQNDCTHKLNCHEKHICGDKLCKILCHKCFKGCKNICQNYEKQYCEKISKSPYICNGCHSYYICEYDKNIYKSVEAYKRYKSILTDSRSGFDITLEDLEIVNSLASPLIKNGLSPFHIKQTYADELPVSEATLRRMIDKEVIDARNIDLRDKVKRKPRKKREIQPLSAAKIGHFYSDFLKYIETHDASIAEMDCVIGKKGDEATLLTLTIRNLSLQLAFIMEQHTSECVVATLDKIEIAIGTSLFREIFGLILTDNGTEFANINGMEKSCFSDEKRTSIYFCDPNRSNEKGSCENHHRMIRFIIPKGTSLESFYQSDISLMMNHINSYKRKALYGKSAYEVAKSVLPEEFFFLLGLEEIPPEEIILNPSLFKKPSK